MHRKKMDTRGNYVGRTNKKKRKRASRKSLKNISSDDWRVRRNERRSSRAKAVPRISSGRALVPAARIVCSLPSQTRNCATAKPSK
ncbi:unnamed protein product, partial [Iphiclides podalirius]